MLKRLFSFLLCVCLIACICLPTATISAAQVHKGVITIESVSGLPGDIVIVPINIEQNPGIMAMTISITYNAEALQYQRYYFGDVIDDYYMVDHPQKNLMRFVNCQREDTHINGTILKIKFKIKDTAEADFHKINIEYSAGDFCNWNLDKIMPEIVSGGVEVAYNGSNCKHKKYGEWKEIVGAGCEENGVEQRVCKTCEHVESRDLSPIGHEYPDFWTVDEVATPEKDGLMSRHCIRCDDRVDIMSFTYDHTTEDDTIKNEANAEVPKNDYTEDMFYEQYPGQQLTPNKPQSGTSSTPEDNSSSSSRNESATASDLVSSAITSKPSDTSSTNSENSSSDDTKTENTTTSEDNSSSDKSSPDENEDSSADTTIPTITDTITALDKLQEAFPEFENILDYFKTAVVVLIILIFI